MEFTDLIKRKEQWGWIAVKTQTGEATLYHNRDGAGEDQWAQAKIFVDEKGHQGDFFHVAEKNEDNIETKFVEAKVYHPLPHYL